MAVAMACECGKSLRVADGLEGKKVRCPACKRILTVPAAVPVGAPDAGVVEASPAVPAIARIQPNADSSKSRRSGEGPAISLPRSRSRSRIGQSKAPREPMPGLAIVLVILGFIDAAVVSLIALLVTLIGGLVVASSDTVGEMGQTMVEAPADSFVRQVKEEGGEILEDRIIRAEDGTRHRRIRYRTTGGGTGTSEFPAGEDVKKAVKEAKNVGGVLVLVGILILLVALGKVITGIAFLVKRNWGRIGGAALAGAQAILVLVGILTGGLSTLLAASFVLNLALLLVLLTPRVRAAVR